MHSARDYSTVTEVPGIRVTAEAMAMAYSRYAFAAEQCADRDVLEVACGAGPGLGCIGARARRLVAADFTADLLHRARQHYQHRVPLVRLDAHALPFGSGSFDVILLFEAVYYLADVNRFFEECHRVLRRPGLLMLCTVNCQWRDFNPSPFSTRYLSAPALRSALAESGFGVDLFGGFPVADDRPASAAVSRVKRAAIRSGLMPRTMKGKELLKRLFLGPLVAVPNEFEPGATIYDRPVPINGSGEARFKVIYAVARPR